jgi:hypothetical protein
MMLLRLLTLLLFVQSAERFRRSGRHGRENYLVVVRGLHLVRHLVVYARFPGISLGIPAGQSAVDLVGVMAGPEA